MHDLNPIDMVRRLKRREAGPPQGKVVGPDTMAKADAHEVETRHDLRYWAWCSSCTSKRGVLALIAQDPATRWLCEDCIRAGIEALESEDELRRSLPEHRAL